MGRDAPRVGVLGAGYSGSQHARVLRGLERVSEVALIDTGRDRLATLSRPFPSAREFADLEDAFPHIDALLIALPPATHVPLPLSAIAAGRFVPGCRRLTRTASLGRWRSVALGGETVNTTICAPFFSLMRDHVTGDR